MQYPILHEPTFRAQWSYVIAPPPKSQSVAFPRSPSV